MLEEDEYLITRMWMPGRVYQCIKQYGISFIMSLEEQNSSMFHVLGANFTLKHVNKVLILIYIIKQVNPFLFVPLLYRLAIS